MSVPSIRTPVTRICTAQTYTPWPAATCPRLLAARRLSRVASLSRPSAFSTHWITVSEGIAVKRFRSPAGDERRLYGDEPAREWRALTLLERYAPGLGPRPIRADLNADPPLIAMSQVPGEPLGIDPATKAQEVAIAAALTRLHHAIPPPVLAAVEPAPGRSPQLLRDRIRDMSRARDPESLDPLPRQAHQAALAWLDCGAAQHPAAATGQPVFTQCDPNLANHLWDGQHVRLVDFETSGRSDRATELADFTEHITVWAHAGIDAAAFLDRFDLAAGERQQVKHLRRLFAAFWVMRLLPSGSAHHRNPPGTLDRQASRLLDLLDSC